MAEAAEWRKRTVMLERMASGSVRLVDASWPPELDVTDELLDEASSHPARPSGIALEGDDLTIEVTNAKAQYRRQPGRPAPGVVRFGLVAGYREA